MEFSIKIKPLSVNDAWQGKRFKTPEYKNYEQVMLWSLPKERLPEPPYRVYYEFGFSNPQSDFDNPCKPLGDVMQKRYGFNDKDIYEAYIRKKVVKKGEEYIRVKIIHINIEGYGTKSKKCGKQTKVNVERKTETVCANSRIPRQR